jgi:hypothetical protein
MHDRWFATQKPQRRRIIRMCLPIIHNIDPTIQLPWHPLFLVAAAEDMLHWHSIITSLCHYAHHGNVLQDPFTNKTLSSHNIVFSPLFIILVIYVWGGGGQQSLDPTANHARPDTPSEGRYKKQQTSLTDGYDLQILMLQHEFVFQITKLFLCTSTG